MRRMIPCGFLVCPKTVTYKTVAGHAIEADLYHPGGAVRPLIFFTHGGAIAGGGHGFDGRANDPQAAFEKVLAFLRSHLQ
jgi:dipeptidyl aminopeptidase/acylaminoacyl peptidase